MPPRKKGRYTPLQAAAAFLFAACFVFYLFYLVWTR